LYLLFQVQRCIDPHPAARSAAQLPVVGSPEGITGWVRHQVHDDDAAAAGGASRQRARHAPTPGAKHAPARRLRDQPAPSNRIVRYAANLQKSCPAAKRSYRFRPKPEDMHPGLYFCTMLSCTKLLHVHLHSHYRRDGVGRAVVVRSLELSVVIKSRYAPISPFMPGGAEPCPENPGSGRRSLGARADDFKPVSGCPVAVARET
jgi:hypothetical protein